MTQEEVAAKLGISKARVQQIEDGAIAKLRKRAETLCRYRRMYGQASLMKMLTLAHGAESAEVLVTLTEMAEGWFSTLPEPVVKEAVSKRLRIRRSPDEPEPNRSGHARKTDEPTVRAIRKDRAAGMIYKDLSAKYKLSIGAINHIVARRSWWWVRDEEGK